MNKIKILPPNEAQKIAAGEVVEQPASVVKETIENCIDAKAQTISLYIEQSGKKLIRIVDDGIGMSKEDAKLCFLPHATSKIKCLDDLEKINSFGFRGEALASISAVAKVRLTTKLKEENLGRRLEYINGEFTKKEEIACNSGTDLKIADLFYNTPARKKFLKADETEWNQIQNTFYAFCLSNPSIHFKLFRDDKQILNAPKTTSLKDRISQVWGHNFTENLIELSKEADDSKNKETSINGCISNHNFWRYGRSQIFFFVNNRCVKNQDLSRALHKGYLNVLPPGKYPAAFIFINVDTTSVDVNVHPRKEEVQFSKPLSIKNAVKKLVKTTLEEYLEEKLSTHNNSGEVSNFNFDNTPFPSTNIEQNFSQTSSSSHNQFEPKKIDPWLSNANTLIQTKKKPYFVASSIDQFIQNKQKPPQKPKDQQYQKTTCNYGGKIIGQLLQTYILIDQGDSLVIIDQHAAHERILYEQSYHYFDRKEGIQLLFPETISISEKQLEMVLNQRDFFLKQGIELEQLGQNEIAIKTSPPKIQSQSLKELIFEIIDFIEENQHLEEELFYKKLNEHTHGQMACKAAVKAGDKLTIQEMEEIITTLKQTNNKLICVHGRPTTWIVSKKEIEKNFKRHTSSF